jgi:hypothetical protein
MAESINILERMNRSIKKAEFIVKKVKQGMTLEQALAKIKSKEQN